MSRRITWTLDELVVKDPEAAEQSEELEELVATAHREHTFAVRAGLQAVEHAIAAGDALLLARDKVERGKWDEWLRTNFPEWSTTTSRIYMRLARHKDHLRDKNAASIRQAMQLCVGLPDSRVNPDLQSRARKLFADGQSYRAIAAELGVAIGTLSGWLANAREPVRPAASPTATQRAPRPSLKGLVRELLDDAELVDDPEGLYGYLVSPSLIGKLREAVA